MTNLVPFVDLSIIIPAYNEEHRITPTLERLARFLESQPLRYEILVVDDGSSDRTVAVVSLKMAQIKHLHVVRQTPNRGKGAAVRLAC